MRWKKFFLGLVALPVALWAEGEPVASTKVSPAEAVPHYDVSWSKDMPVTFFAAFVSAFGNYRYGQMESLESGDYRDVSDLLPWDRPVAGRYSESADRASNWAALLGVAPLALAGYSYGMGDASGAEFAGFSLMFVQALALQSGINLCARSMQFWPRPYVYAKDGYGSGNREVVERAKNARPEAYGSFFSGHTSAAFTVAVFTGEWFSEFYPQSPYRGVVWALALSAAGIEGMLRIAAGKHYPTDVVAGALVGTGVSLAVIQVHKNRNDRLSLWAYPGAAGLTISI